MTESLDEQVEREYAKNLKLSQSLKLEETSSLATLDGMIKRVKTVSEAQNAIYCILRKAGYDILLSGESSLGFPLRVDPHLNGNFNLGSLVPLQPEMEELNPSQKIFLKTVAERSGVLIDYVRAIQRSERVSEENDLTRRLIAHESANHLNTLCHFPRVIIGAVQNLNTGECLSLKRQEKIIDGAKRIEKRAWQMSKLLKAINLGSLSKKELRKNAERFDLEESIRETIKNYEEDLLDKKLSVEFRYDYSANYPIYIFAHKGFLDIILQTDFENQLDHAADNSVIVKGLRIENENLVLNSENLKRTVRRGIYGFKEGLGRKFMQKIEDKYHGKIEIYSEKDNYCYQNKERFGSANIKNPEVSGIYGLRISIPLKELSFEK